MGNAQELYANSQKSSSMGRINDQLKWQLHNILCNEVYNYMKLENIVNVYTF